MKKCRKDQKFQKMKILQRKHRLLRMQNCIKRKEYKDCKEGKNAQKT